MEAVKQRIGESFAEVKKNLSPHLADELADTTLENLMLTNLPMTQNIHACQFSQALEKASPAVVKSVCFPDWFFLASSNPSNAARQLLASRDLTYAHDTKIKDLEVEVANLKIANEQRETAETNAAQQFNELKELVRDCNARMESYSERDSTAVQQRLTASDKLLKDCRVTIQMLTGQVAALLNDNQDMREEMATYQASSMEGLKFELISHRNELDDENKRIWAEDAHTKEEMTRLRAELSNVEDKLGKQHKAHGLLKKAHSHLKQAHESLHNTMTNFKNDLERDWGMFCKSPPALTPKRKDGTDLESRDGGKRQRVSGPKLPTWKRGLSE
ncbi:hypothetical protein ACHAPI_010555 [Fusarium lateritium]